MEKSGIARFLALVALIAASTSASFAQERDDQALPTASASGVNSRGERFFVNTDQSVRYESSGCALRLRTQVTVTTFGSPGTVRETKSMQYRIPLDLLDAAAAAVTPSPSPSGTGLEVALRLRSGFSGIRASTGFVNEARVQFPASTPGLARMFSDGVSSAARTCRAHPISAQAASSSVTPAIDDEASLKMIAALAGDSDRVSAHAVTATATPPARGNRTPAR